MKKHYPFLWSLLACAGMLTFPACESDNADGDPSPLNRPSFTVKTEVLLATEAELLVTPPNEEVPYLACLFGTEEVNGKDDNALTALCVEGAEPANSVFRGTQTLRFTDLQSETGYYLICLYYNPAQHAAASLPYRSKTITTPIDYTNLSFSILAGKIRSTLCDVHLTPSNANSSYYACFYAKQVIEDKTDDELIASALTSPTLSQSLYKGEQNFHFDNLNPDTDYELICFGYDAESKSVATKLFRSETITTAPLKQADFRIEMDGIGKMWAKYTITPPDEEMNWVYSILTKERYDTEAAGSGILAFDQTGWQQEANEQQLPSWINALSKDLQKGPLACQEKQFSLRPGTEYTIYCYGRTADGDATTTITQKTFTTLIPTPSDNKITVLVDATYTDGVEATVTTTNNDPYYILIQPKSIELLLPEGVDKLTCSLINLFEEAPIHSGDRKFRKEDFQELEADSDYYLIVFGYDEGASTELQMIPFRTQPLAAAGVAGVAAATAR